MKKVFFLLVAVLPFLFAGCSKDDDPKFDYDINALYGTWQMTHWEINGTYVDITSYVSTTTSTFNSDGSYSGRGYFGTGSGTYSATGKTIICYVGGQEYIRYEVLALSGSQCELKMTQDRTSIKIKCKKR